MDWSGVERSSVRGRRRKEGAAVFSFFQPLIDRSSKKKARSIAKKLLFPPKKLNLDFPLSPPLSKTTQAAKQALRAELEAATKARESARAAARDAKSKVEYATPEAIDARVAALEVS